jgi:peptide/nickel transport system substrate-binding protein
MGGLQPTRGIPRRRFLLTSATFAATALVAACSAAATPTPVPQPTAPQAAPPAPKAPPAEPTTAATPTAVAAASPTAAPTTAPTTAPAASPTAAATTAAAGSGQLKDVPRNRTLILAQGGSEGKMQDWNNWNPYNLGGNHQTGSNIFFEPLAYYSAYADKEYPWLAESYVYSPDFKQLTIKTRSGITWSDGQPFSAEDVAFTFNSLKEFGSKVKWGIDVQQVMDSATATDPNTVVVKFTVPAPRFFWQATYEFDIGIYIVPKHIFQGQDWTTFTYFDLAKGWPATTGPWRVVAASPEQKVMDLADSWWAVKQGLLSAMPLPQRMIYLPLTDQTAIAQSLITNKIDYGSLIMSNLKEVVDQNQKVTSFSGRASPYGNEDWWPLGFYVNCSKPPFDDANVRWAISYYLDRNQIINVAYGDNSAIVPSPLPMPSYPALQPYFDVCKDLFQKWDTNKYDPTTADGLLTKKGWKKGSDGMWVDEKGQPVKFDITGWSFLADIGPVVSQVLKKHGIDATWTQPPDADTRFQKGDYIAAIYGHGGSVREPYATLRLYQSATLAVPGAHEANFPKWSNKDYDKIVDQVYGTSMDDKAKLTDLFHQAMQIWLPELPDIQLNEFYHNIGYNESYWTGWPNLQNPYINPASWHLTWQLVLNNLKPTQ